MQEKGPRRRQAWSVVRAIWIAAWLLVSASVFAQAATERYIPIGRSPGISGIHSVAGVIESVDGRAIAIRSGTSVVRVELADTSDIWIDRSKNKVTNLRGTPADLVVGRTVEAYLPRWIKVEPR